MSTEREGKVSIPLLQPEVYIANTGDGEIVQDRMENFFERVLKVMGYQDEAQRQYLEIVPFGLHTESPTEPIPTDQRVTVLLVADSVVASVIERRNNLNYIQVASACYLTKESLMGLKNLIEKPK